MRNEPGFTHSPGYGVTAWQGRGGLANELQGRPIRDLPADGKRKNKMLEIIAVILVVLWLLGFLTSTTMGGFIHILLVIAVVVILVRVIQGRKV